MSTSLSIYCYWQIFFKIRSLSRKFEIKLSLGIQIPPHLKDVGKSLVEYLFSKIAPTESTVTADQCIPIRQKQFRFDSIHARKSIRIDSTVRRAYCRHNQQQASTINKQENSSIEIMISDCDDWRRAMCQLRYWLNYEIIVSVWCQHRQYRTTDGQMANFAYKLQQLVVANRTVWFFWESESNRFASRIGMHFCRPSTHALKKMWPW